MTHFFQSDIRRPLMLLGHLVSLVLFVFPVRPAVAEESSSMRSNHRPVWREGYEQGRAEAIAQRRLMLVQLLPENADAAAAASWRDSLTDSPARCEMLSAYSLATASLDEEVDYEGERVKLRNHGAFAELQGEPGLAVIDFRDPESTAYRTVLSLIPCAAGKSPMAKAYPNLQQVDILLNLPEGSLTQRTLVYAVRTHPDQPQSASGQWHPALVDEVSAHATHQASIRLQGHHAWDQRFHRINARLPPDVVAQEVCAESWGGQGLWAAARECVRSWRQSSGHWSAVSGAHPYFAYDMKRGANGVWYATGIFGKRR